MGPKNESASNARGEKSRSREVSATVETCPLDYGSPEEAALTQFWEGTEFGVWDGSQKGDDDQAETGVNWVERKGKAF